MAFPLKSGADLYNQQLIRAAIWNHGADPSETVTGLLYFNTSNSNVGKKLRVHNGSGWKTLAFEEDLDVATNADFVALKAKVDLLSGEVDTDAIISNMKEVTAFLAGFAEDANLMSVLDGKLDKSGGTIKGNTYVPLKVVGTSVRTSIGFSKDASVFAYLTYNGGSSWAVTNEYYNNEYTLLHSGNIGEYNAGSATKLETPRTIWGQSFDGTGNVSGNLNLNMAKLIWHGEESYSISCPNTATAARLKYVAYDGHLFRSAAGQAMLINTLGNVTIGGSDLAGTSAKLYVNGNAKIEVGNRLHIFADNVFASYDKTIGGFYMYGGIREGEALSCEVAGVGGAWVGAGFKLMQNGNFGIGLTPSAQLHVNKDIVANGTIACKGIAAEGDAMDMVDKTVLHIPSSTTQQTFTLNHGLGTREITVSIYETTTLGTNMILTDVEIVDDNNISVSFGNPPSEEHMVVVMG